jgi:uncharacterized protein (TIRG00374 family)
MSRRGKLKLLVGITLSAGCLYAVLRNLDATAVWRSLRQASPSLILVASLLNLFSMLVRTMRWREVLRPVGNFCLRHQFVATSIGFMANNVLPARAGELVRAHIFAKRASAPFTMSVATIVVCRLFDMVVLVALLGVTLLGLKLPAATGDGAGGLDAAALRASGIVAALGAAAGLAFLYILRTAPGQTTSFARWCLRPAPSRLTDRLLGLLERFTTGLHVLRSAAALLRALAWTLVIWLVSAGIQAVVLAAFDLHLPWTAPFLLVVMTAFAAAIPSSPGYIGPFHFACYIGLTAYGVDKDLSGTVALVIHAVMILPVTLLGFAVAAAASVPMSELKTAEREADQSGLPPGL